jgi:hypothetical protein
MDGSCAGGQEEPDIRVEPDFLFEELCPDQQNTVPMEICNDGTAPLFWTLEEIPPGGRVQDVLWDNGPLVTHPGGGSGGADASVLQTNLGMNTYGFGHQYSQGFRVADDFPVDGDWTVDQITFFAYQTNSPTDPSTFLGYNLAVWDGPPAAGGSIIWGDYATNCMIDTSWMGAYRVTDYDMGGTARPIMANVCATPGLVLTPGQYWLDWQADGSLSSGPWAPPSQCWARPPPAMACSRWTMACRSPQSSTAARLHRKASPSSSRGRLAASRASPGWTRTRPAARWTRAIARSLT